LCRIRVPPARFTGISAGAVSDPLDHRDDISVALASNAATSRQPPHRRRHGSAFAHGVDDFEGFNEETTMIGALLMLACVAGAIYMLVKMFKAYHWHNQGTGERNGHAEYARIQREQPDSAEARLSEAEFVNQYVASRPGMARYLIFGLLLAFIGIPAACTVGVVGSLH
jgi:hypothetical protein